MKTMTCAQLGGPCDAKIQDAKWNDAFGSYAS